MGDNHNNSVLPSYYASAKRSFDSSQPHRLHNEKETLNKNSDSFDTSTSFPRVGSYFRSYYERVRLSAQVSRGVVRVRNLVQSSGPGQILSGGLPRRLFTAVLLGMLCVLGFSLLLPARSRPPQVLPVFPTYLSHHHVPPSHLYPLPLTATLDERLATWRHAPGLWWEPADFVAWNLQTCSNVIPNHNKDLLAKSSLIWGVMNSTAVLTHRENMVRYIEEMRDKGAFNTDRHVTHGGTGYVGKGRGMVFTAGNVDTLQRVLYTLKLVRKYYGSELPAAVFHFSSERPADDDPIRAQLKEYGAKLVEIHRTKDGGRRKNYHLKAQAIVESEWAEVLYLDSDNFPTQAPEFYFEQANYKRLGAMFWVDYWKTSANNPIWHIIGVQCRDEWEQEAGQIVIDKRRHLDALLLAQYMLINWEYWYYFSDGDKDVFRFSFLALRKRWALPGRYVGAAGLPSGTASGDFCSHTMQQFDNAGRPAFVHYNLLKQIPSGVGRGFSWGRTKQVMAFPTPSLRPITKEEFLKAGLNHTDKWWEEDSRSYQQRQRYRMYPYPDADGPDVVRGAHDVEADMLANAKDDGWAIQPASPEVRRRAAVERGLRPYFHGGVISALCIDFNWEDPKGSRREANTVGEPPDKTAPNELGIDWGYSPLEIVQWTADELLRDMEQRVYDEGFVPSAVGF